MTFEAPRAIQIEGDGLDILPIAPKVEKPSYDWAPTRLKKFGGDMRNISYTEMCQLSETLAHHLFQVEGIAIGPHVLAKALFDTVDTLDLLPGDKPIPQAGPTTRGHYR